MRIDHFEIGVRDLDRALNWYRDVIGLREVAELEGRIYLGCGGRPEFDLVLELGEPGLRHVAYFCCDRDEFETAKQRAGGQGIELVAPAHLAPGVLEAASLTLPGGQVVQLLLREGADRYPRVAQWSRDAMHSPREIDHVNIAVTDVDATVAILGSALGLVLSDVHQVDGHGTVGAWMRAGDRHHDFAIIRNKQAGLHHIAYQAADASALIEFADRLAIAGTPSEYGIGRHGPGSNLFLYVRDPSGNRVEITADMAVVPPGAPHGVWNGTDPSIVNSLAPYGPPRAFWEIT